MTCEIAVMNKFGIALATDSAITLGNGAKIYHHSEKLFCLSPNIPVGIMTYGSADLMGVPWEVVIKMYAAKRDGIPLDRLQDYANEFFPFIESLKHIFSDALQARAFRRGVGSYWSNMFLEEMKEKMKENEQSTEDQCVYANEILRELLAKDHAIWEQYEEMEGLGSAFADEVLDLYDDQLKEIEETLFGDYDLAPDVRADLRKTAHAMIAKKWGDPDETSGLIIAGFGEEEALPSLLHYNVGSIVGWKLRGMKLGRDTIDHEVTACVAPFAQTDMIDLFYEGMHRDLQRKMADNIGEIIASSWREKGQALDNEQQEALTSRALEHLHEKIIAEYKEPLMAAVAGLPRHDLARLAETLISLTAFRAHMSTDQKETVGGPIDVALISKGDGFVWVKNGRL